MVTCIVCYHFIRRFYEYVEDYGCSKAMKRFSFVMIGIVSMIVCFYGLIVININVVKQYVSQDDTIRIFDYVSFLLGIEMMLCFLIYVIYYVIRVTIRKVKTDLNDYDTNMVSWHMQ